MKTIVRLSLALACIVAALVCGRAAIASDDRDWSSLSMPAFRSVGDVVGNTVTAIAEDASGVLWIGGESGLSRFDGYRFHAFSPDPQNRRALPDGWVNAIHEDRHGRLWIGTMSGGLTRYEAASDAFVTTTAGPDTFATNTVNALADDAEGLWIGTSGGLEHRLDATGSYVHYRHDERHGSLPDKSVRALLFDRRGTLWVGTESGLARRDPGSESFTRVPLPTADGVAPVVLSLFEDGRRRLWIGTRRHGAYVIAADRGPATTIRPSGGASATTLLQGETIRSIDEVRPGELWFGSFDHGIFALSLPSQQLRMLQHDPEIDTSLQQNDVRSIYRDRSGVVWVGTAVGLRRANVEQAALVTLRPASARSAGIAGTDATALYAAPHNRLWLGLSRQGIEIVDPVRGHLATLRPRLGTRAGAALEGRVRNLAAGPDGSVYIATDRGVFRADRDLRRLGRAVVAGGRHDDVNSIAVAAGRLWVVTPDGVWSAQLPIGTRPAVVRRERMPGLSDPRVSVIVPASPGRLWVGTFGGLNLLDVATGRVQNVGEESGRHGRLAKDFITSILTDRLGRLWIGTSGGGIEISDPYRPGGHPRFSQLSTRQGLPNMNVDALLLDRTGRVWASTDGGIAVIDPVTRAVREIDDASGVKAQTYFYNLSAARLENGDLAFGGGGSVAIVRPSRVHDRNFSPPLVVTDVQVGGRKLVAGAFDGRSDDGPLIVPADTNSLAVEFAALDYSAPDQNRYEYRLDGYDSGWIDTPASRRLASYTNLPPGRYGLELRGSNRDGVWNAVPLVVPVVVVAAWYQTTAFKIAEGAAALVAILIFVQIRTSILRRREHDLEAQVSQRTAELQALALELGESQQRFMHLAYSDALTDLPNRRRFGEAFASMIATAREHERETALLLIDFDHFKRINDRHGHAAGDALLVEAAERLRRSVRKADCVARLGGDEFAIVLADDLTTDAVDALCARIIASFASPIHFKGVEMATTPSIGVAVFPTDGSNSEELYRCADSALYEAKRAGRNTVRRFDLQTWTAH